MMIIKSKEFPIIAIRYMAQNRIPIQHCTDSRPGIPIRVNTEGMKIVTLEMDMMTEKHVKNTVKMESAKFSPWEILLEQ